MTSLLARIVSALVLFAAMPAASAQRGGMNVPEHPTRPVIMELFSSQGCGNCPTANANLAKLAERSDVIALTYPVNIWDYLGWDDTFAKPEFSDRQKLYNRALGYRGPYTPQVVYSGVLHGPGTSIKDIEERFGKRDISPYPVSVAFDKDGLAVSGALPDKVTKGIVVIVHYRPGVTTVTPGGGANKGKSMTYWNLVTRIEDAGDWTGGAQHFAAKCDDSCVVLIQKDSSEGKVIGALQKK